ncbi:MAG: hypothetical protein LUF02_09080 [Erysipelotrichaceae bacterium]|nr:hypothetical protein [Erysipelotrichaceae bacterium]
MSKFREKLNKSFICYLSDLFITVMVIAWITIIVVETVMAIYATVVLCDVSIWYNVTELVSVPLTAGRAIWMIKK